MRTKTTLTKYLYEGQPFKLFNKRFSMDDDLNKKSSPKEQNLLKNENEKISLRKASLLMKIVCIQQIVFKAFSSHLFMKTDFQKVLMVSNGISFK